MSPLVIVVIVVFASAFAYGMSRLQARTSRTASITMDDATFPNAAVRKALERIGCTITRESAKEVCGLMPPSGGYWGQDLTIKSVGVELVISSRFAGSQIFGGNKNQENIDRFIEEWRQREKYEHQTQTEIADNEDHAKKVAKKSVMTGAAMTVAGAGILLLVILVPARPGASPGGKYRLIGLALPVLGMGIASVSAGIRRLRRSSNDDQA